MKNFALTGVAGYIAPRHLKAIKDTGNRLVAGLDPHDSVGLLDKYFDNVSFFTEFERFDRYLEKQRIENSPLKIDYLSICSPNYLHDSHVRLAIRSGAHAICEKPLVLNPWNCDALTNLLRGTNQKVYNILQLRLHPTVIELRERFQNSSKKSDVNLTYITPRGPWYQYSWKGDVEKSGGLATNIGIHFFDMLIWIFGEPVSIEIEEATPIKIKGELRLENANVRWFLSIDKKDLPKGSENKETPSFREITFNGESVEFSEGFTDLHTASYRDILQGNGFGIEDARPSIELVSKIRSLGNNGSLQLR